MEKFRTNQHVIVLKKRGKKSRVKKQEKDQNNNAIQLSELRT